MSFGYWLVLGVLSVLATALSVAIVGRAKSSPLTHDPKRTSSPARTEFERLTKAFGLVLWDEPPSIEFCEVLKLLQGRCTAVTGMKRFAELVVPSIDDENFATSDGRITEEFPWDDVDAARADLGLQSRFNPETAIREFGAKAECRICHRHMNELTWCYFVSPDWTWEHLCGRAGWLAICDICHVQALFVCDALN